MFKLGDVVRWRFFDQQLGMYVTVFGTVIQIIPAGTKLKFGDYTPRKPAMKRESYLIEDNRQRCYWPAPSRLRLVANP